MTPWDFFERGFLGPRETRSSDGYVHPESLDGLTPAERARAADLLADALAERFDLRQHSALQLLDAPRAERTLRGIVAREGGDPESRARALASLLYANVLSPERSLLPEFLADGARPAAREAALSGARRVADAHPDAEVRAGAVELLLQGLPDPAQTVRAQAYNHLLSVLRLREVLPDPDPATALAASDLDADRRALLALVRERAKRVRVDPFSREVLRAHLREICRDEPGTCPRCAAVGNRDVASGPGWATPCDAHMERVIWSTMPSRQQLHRCPDCRRPIFERYSYEGWYTTGHEESWDVIRDGAIEQFVAHRDNTSFDLVVRLDDRVALTMR